MFSNAFGSDGALLFDWKMYYNLFHIASCILVENEVRLSRLWEQLEQIKRICVPLW